MPEAMQAKGLAWLDPGRHKQIPGVSRFRSHFLSHDILR
jgi:hypothetical protein